MFYVVISEKDGNQERLEFDKKEITVGRVQGNDIILNKGNVSKRHARVVLKDGKFIIVDLKSTNGTFVNGRRISSPQVIKGSDRVSVGDFTLAVESPDIDMSDKVSGSLPNLGSASTPMASVPSVPAENPARAAAPVVPRPIGPALVSPREEPAPISAPNLEIADASSEDAAFNDMTNNERVASENVPANNPVAMPARPPLVLVSQEPEAPKSIAAPIVAASPRVIVEPPLVGVADEEQLQQRAHLVLQLSETVDLLETGPYGVWSAAALESARTTLASLAGGNASSVLVAQAHEEATGLGPLGPLLADASILEITIAGPHHVTSLRSDGRVVQEAAFSTEIGLRGALARLLKASGYTLHTDERFVDVRLQDGTLLVAALSQHGATGSRVSLRKTLPQPASLGDLVTEGMLSQNAALFLQACVKSRRGILLVGAGSSGKSTLLQALAQEIPSEERVALLRESAAMQIVHPQLLSFVVQPSTWEQAIRQSLRMQCQRLLLHHLPNHASQLVALLARSEGVLATMPALSGQEAIDQFWDAAHEDTELASDVFARVLNSLFALVVHLYTMPDGSNKVLQIAELCVAEGTEPEAENIALQDIFTWQNEQLESTKQVPLFWQQLGIEDTSLFA